MGDQMATDPISLQQLRNASEDAQDLENFVNDDTPALVPTRIGGSKPNYAKLVADFQSSAQIILNETQQEADEALDRMTSFVDRGVWLPSTAYARKDVVTFGGIAYITLADHTSSSSFENDLAAGLWQIFQGVNRAELADSSGSTLFGFQHSGVGVSTRTGQEKLRDLRSVLDHADESVTDFTTALNNATVNPEVVLLPRRVGGYPLNGIVSPHADATVLSLFSNPVVSVQELEALNLLQFRGGYPCGLPVLSNMRDRKIEVVAGAIRQDVVDRTKWNYITSTYHRPTGILGAAANAFDAFNIQVTYKKSFDEVIFFAAHPDEWMASRKNISVGTSVGQDTTEIQLGGSIEVYAELIFNASTGTWAATGWNDMYNNGNVVPTWDAGTNLLTVAHDYCPELNIRVESIYPANCFAYRRSANATQTVIGFHDGSWNAIVPADTMRVVFTKVYNGPIQVDGSANSGTLGLHQGNIWFFGLFGRQ